MQVINKKNKNHGNFRLGASARNVMLRCMLRKRRKNVLYSWTNGLKCKKQDDDAIVIKINDSSIKKMMRNEIKVAVMKNGSII